MLWYAARKEIAKRARNRTTNRLKNLIERDMPQNRAIAIFTDLDSTLLDHDTYSWAAARPALDRIKHFSIPLIAVSSKTLAELEHLNLISGLFDGLIGENGGVSWLYGKIEYAGPTIETIDAARAEITEAVSVPVTSFRTVAPEIIAAETGLTLDDAVRAGQRRCSDPLIWQPSRQDIDLARSIAERRSLTLVQGGRFHTLCGRLSKGDAMARMIERLALYRQDTETQGTPTGPEGLFTTIALGDSCNDIPMLRAADIAVQIPPKHGGTPKPLLEHPNLHIAPCPGPEGWNMAVTGILDRILPGDD